MPFLLLLVVLVVLVLAMFLSARRFEVQERKLGKWDDNGPLVETQGPPDRFKDAGMEERLEVIGEWTPPITHDRRAETQHHPAQTDDEPTRKRD